MLLGVALLHAQITPNANGIVYVDEQGSGNKSGDSWANAAEIRPSFMAAKTNTAIQQIWIKSGTYYPTNDTDRQKYLEITRNIKVYGGFNGTENLIADRDLATNTTTLSGNIGNVATSTDNSYHLLVVWPKTDAVISDQTIIDGIVFKEANANSGAVINQELPLYMGAALFITIQDYSQKSYPIVSNCKFLNNAAYQGGAAIYFDGLLSTSEQLSIKQCHFEGNSSSWIGGALMFFYDEAFLDAGNTAQHYYNVDVANCTFKNNSVNNNSQSRGAESSGGAICALGKGNLTVRNSTFNDNATAITFTAHNYATYGNGSAIAAVKKANVTIYNSLFYNNNKATVFNREANLKLINSTLHHAANELISLSMASSFEFYNSIAWNDAVNIPAILLPDNQPQSAIIKNSVLNASPALVLTSSANVFSQNPLFAGANNFAPSSGSVAVNAGDDALYTGNVNLLTDKDIYGNPRLDGAKIDIGAVEYQTALPVTLVGFNVAKQLNGALLTWKTETEINHKEFVVLRAGNGVDFKFLGKIPAKGPGSYSWYDASPQGGKNYYQLQQVDYNGLPKNLAMGVLDFQIASISAYPNPTQNIIKVDLAGHVFKEAALFNMTGQQLEIKTILPNDVAVSFDLSKFSSGLYLVKLLGNETSTLRVLKQ